MGKIVKESTAKKLFASKKAYFGGIITDNGIKYGIIERPDTMTVDHYKLTKQD